MRGVELLSALEPARVVHAHGVARLGLGARALEDLDVLEPCGRLDHLLFGHLSSGGERRRSSPRPPHRIHQMVGNKSHPPPKHPHHLLQLNRQSNDNEPLLPSLLPPTNSRGISISDLSVE